ncbi:MAG: ATP-binding protein [Bacteroidales bacterium]|nr:ATP-binding protein [Bacteroidales bacterium]MBN2756496.1 ATP-binding protein [Bacteroidales bacterium]
MDSEYLIDRDIYSKILNHLSKKEITIISGTRQCGKSTILHKLRTNLEKAGENTIFLNFDFEKDKKFLETQESLINKLEFEFGNNKAYVFIDEIQRKEDAGLYLKGIYDLKLPYKFIVSGSGSIELKEKIQESLAGRKRVFEMNTVNFTEFVNYKTDYKYSDRLDKYFEFEKEKTDELLIEFMNYGGYPRIVTEKDVNEKTELINEIYNSYIERDLIRLLNINNAELFKDIFRMLSIMSGKLINFSNIADDTSTSVQTLKKYLHFAEKTYSIKTIRPYFNNSIKELRKSPMIYFTDIGLMNFTIGKYGLLSNSMDFGFVFQNFVYNILKDKVLRNMEIKYWRTTDKAEVDFVVDRITDVIPIEVKYKKLKKETIDRAFRSFIDKYNPEIAYVVNLSLDKTIKIKNTTIRFIPYTKLFVEDLFS